MPNWCENRLEVYANDLSSIKAIFDKVLIFDEQEKNYCVDFNLLIPMPESLYASMAWYDWRCKHWGTKWNADTQYFDNDSLLYLHKNLSFSVDFNTAWNPPIAWISKLIDTFPNVSIKLTYFEPGCLFGGIKSSNPLDSCYYEYPESVEEMFKIGAEFGYSADEFELEE